MKIQRKIAFASLLACGTALATTPAAAQSGDDNYLGELANFGFNFCPRNWASASGQLLAINQNTALFSLLGTTYGGNGVTTFALPDLRGRTPIGYGQGSGLSSYVLGQVGGQESVTMISTQMPAHSHTAMVRVSPNAGTANTPARNTIATSTDPTRFETDTAPVTTMASTTLELASTGGSQPFDTRSPYLTTQWCIATTGIFPSRN